MSYIIADNADETQIELKETVYNLMRETMKIPKRDLFSRMNPSGEIRLDTVNRIGKFRGGNSRPFIASFVTKTGRVSHCPRNMFQISVSILELFVQRNTTQLLLKKRGKPKSQPLKF